MQTRAIILAAGKGTRMKSKKAKVLHELCGVPMIGHVVDNVKEAGFEEVHAVIGTDSDAVRTYLDGTVETTFQDEQLGTAHAVGQLREKLENEEGQTLVICGDTPLISKRTLSALFEYHTEMSLKATVLSVEASNPFGYGRIVRNYDGSVKSIVEEKDAASEIKEIREISSGTFIFDNKVLFEALEHVKNDNVQAEYYLPDVIPYIFEHYKKVDAYKSEVFDEILGINDRVALSKAEEIMREQINIGHMQNGVTLMDPKAAYIDKNVTIGEDTVIYPNVVLRGTTTIGSNVTITNGSEITDSVISDEAVIKQSVVTDSKVGSSAAVGPFAQLRPGTVLGEEVKIGNFVEVKKADIEDGAKVSHLSYIGDASVGARTNIGCGSITVNYDGVNKFKTTIGQDAFIGCNTNLVAPVTVGNRAFIAAGSTITDEVPSDSLAIARSRQTTKDGYFNKDN
ncbi:bifunctional UDP-N-acetylglucosamine diphosphorylase/glucosamine-1-phosphate N-acetyltransferase GlmU [Corticicoccus populi]|uniref:Bifunctional protein GlmU n=1 Tax=Corticicoccus populi TaxID=1812821 RepID=A0ABW5WXR4_9STAP